MIARLLDLFEGPESLSPWTAPEMLAPLHELLPWRAWDERGELYVNAASCGFVIELPPFAGIDEETLGALSGTLADAAPERCTLQFIHWASPRFGAALASWAEPRARAGGVQAAMGRRRDPAGLARHPLSSSSMNRTPRGGLRPGVRRPSAGNIAPRFSTGMPRASAMRMPMPVPPVKAPPSQVQHTTASTGRSRFRPRRIARFLACNLRTAGEQRSQAG